MDAVVGIGGVERDAVFGDHGGEVVDILDAVLRAVGAKAGVERLDLCGSVLDLGPPGELGGGKNRAHDGTDLVGLGQLDHRDDVAEGVVFVVVALVEGYVVAAAKDHYRLCSKVDDVVPEAENHLGCHFAADAALDHLVVVEESGSAFGPPAFGDRVTHENDAPLGALRHRGIFAVEMIIVNEILC